MLGVLTCYTTGTRVFDTQTKAEQHLPLSLMRCMSIDNLLNSGGTRPDDAEPVNNPEKPSCPDTVCASQSLVPEAPPDAAALGVRLFALAPEG